MCMYLYVFVLYFFVFFYVFCMYRLYLAECVCIDAPSNFSCRKYRQIHAIQTNTRIIHTPIFPKYIQKYIKNKSVTMCMYVHVFACICLYLVCIFCMSVFFCIQRHACCMCMYLHVSVCIGWLSLFTRGYMCAVGQLWASRVAEQTRRDHLSWNCALFFKRRQPGSPWAKPWPTCWCSTGGCLSRARHADRTRPVRSTRPCGHACFGEWCRNPLREWEAACPGCETGGQHTRQAQATGGTASWSRSGRCWATKVWSVLGSNRRRSRSGHTGMHILTWYQQIHADTDTIPRDTCRYMQIHAHTYISYLDIFGVIV